MSDKDETLDLAGEVQEGDQLEKAVAKINVTREVLDKLRKQAEAFPTPKAGDKAGYEALKRHRLDIVPLRTMTIKVLKGMREEAITFQKRVIAKEKEITEELAEIEAIDQTKEDAYLAELKAIEDEKARLAALAPDKEKLQALAHKIALLERPEVSTEEAKEILAKVRPILDTARALLNSIK